MSITPGSSLCLRTLGCPAFSVASLRSMYRDSITHVEFAGADRGQSLMARGVRQGCLASGFLFVMAFDPIFRWLQESIISRNTDNLEFLQPALCAYADDFAVASSSFRQLMSALAPEFRSVDYIAGLANAVGFSVATKSMILCIPFYRLHCWPQLEFRKCCWVQVW